jgi:hypothetical protein
MEALKARREAINKAKEEGTFKPEDFKPKPKVKVNGYKPVDPALKPAPRDPPVYVPRKRATPKATTEEIANLIKSSVDSLRAELAPREVVKEVIKEVDVPRDVVREVVKEKVVSGREMLDRIFFSK